MTTVVVVAAAKFREPRRRRTYRGASALQSVADQRPIGSRDAFACPALVGVVASTRRNEQSGLVQDGLTIGELPVSDHSEARRLITSAFAQEPFARVFGDSAVARFVGIANMYSKWPFAPNPVVIGVTAGGHLVGVALATLPGECGLCDVATSSAADCSNEVDRIAHEFQVACLQAHRVNELGPHARVEVVATEPTLHGSGVGRVLMGGVINALRQRRIECVVLECLTTRAAFYEHLGFQCVDEFDDPGGPGLRFVLMKSVVISA